MILIRSTSMPSCLLVKMSALAVGRRHLDQPTLRNREHRIECRLHRIADIGRFILDDELRRGVAPQCIGVARKRDDARAIGEGAARLVVFLELLNGFEPLQEAGGLREQFLRVPQARADQQDEAWVIDRGVQGDECSGRALAALPTTVQ